MSGRATIYKSADAKAHLSLSDSITSNGSDGQVLLVRAGDKALEQEIVKPALDHVELGALRGNQADQNYGLPATVDLNQYQAVAIYSERFTRYLEWRGWRVSKGETETRIPEGAEAHCGPRGVGQS